MRGTAWLIVIGLAAPALADVQVPAPGAKPSAPLPRSIWKLEDDGTLRHLQSELKCPAMVGDYRRIDTRVYDHFGLDVSCNYLNPRRSLITIYLTRRHGDSLDDAFREAQHELLQLTPSAVPAPDEAQKGVALEPGWKHLIYSEKQDTIHSGIWVRDMEGWTLEYRATYAAAEERPVFDTLKTLTDGADASAGAHLHLCGGAAPVRDGVVMNDDKHISPLALAALMHLRLGKDAGSSVPASPPPPASWCVESPAVAAPVLVWHGVDDKGGDTGLDRATLVTMEDPPVLESAPDDVLAKIASELDKTAPPANIPARIYEQTLRNGDTTVIFSFYRGRPDAAALSALVSDIVNRKAVPVGSINTRTNTININPRPPR